MFGLGPNRSVWLGAGIAERCKQPESVERFVARGTPATRKWCMAETVIEYVLRRLNEIGVDDVFGVAGDYAFPVNDAIVEHPAISWIGCCNELNAA